jgi:hypothetical protein
MPDFAAGTAAWFTDRYEPDSFSNVGMVNGRNNVLGIGISSDDAAANRSPSYSSSFYNTQGRQYTVTGGAGAGSVLSADLYLDRSWESAANGLRRTDMWGVMSGGAALSYPIIGFTNDGTGARFRVWDEDTVNGWVDVADHLDFGNWINLSIDFTGTSLLYSIDGDLVYTDNDLNGADEFSAIIMQAYNFYSGTEAPGTEYTAYWANAAVTAVPEPGTLALIGAGLAGIGVLRRRRKAAA